MEPEVYKVTVTNSQGDEMIAYVLPADKQRYVRSMNEEYGNATVEPLMMTDLPEDVTFN
jgi:hypothetical protein